MFQATATHRHNVNIDRIFYNKTLPRKINEKQKILRSNA